MPSREDGFYVAPNQSTGVTRHPRIYKNKRASNLGRRVVDKRVGSQEGYRKKQNNGLRRYVEQGYDA